MKFGFGRSEKPKSAPVEPKDEGVHAQDDTAGDMIWPGQEIDGVPVFDLPEGPEIDKGAPDMSIPVPEVDWREVPEEEHGEERVQIPVPEYDPGAQREWEKKKQERMDEEAERPSGRGVANIDMGGGGEDE